MMLVRHQGEVISYYQGTWASMVILLRPSYVCRVIMYVLCTLYVLSSDTRYYLGFPYSEQEFINKESFRSRQITLKELP